MSKILWVSLAIVLVLLTYMPKQAYAAEYSLEDLYRIALERAEEIGISKKELYIAERDRERALSLLFPRFSAFGDYRRFSEAEFAAGNVIQPEDSMSWGLRLDQSLSLSGREFIALDMSEKGIEKSRHSLYAVKEAYLFGVASAYYALLKAKKAVEILMAGVERLTVHRDASALKLKVGKVTRTALLRAEAELSGAQSELVRAENGLRLARSVLARIVGLDTDFDIKEQRAINDTMEVYTLNSLKELAVLERAELKALDIGKHIAKKQVKYTRGAYWPNLSVEAVYLRRDEDPATRFLKQESIYGGLSLSFCIFDGGFRRAELGKSRARQRQSELIYKDLKKTIEIEVEDAYLEHDTQKGVLKSLRDRLLFARDNFDAISKQFKLGLASSIDVVDAHKLLVTAERELTDAEYSYQLSILRLKRVTGTLLLNSV